MGSANEPNGYDLIQLMTVNRSSDARNVMQNSKNLDPLIPMNSDYAEQPHLNVDLTTIENSLQEKPNGFDLIQLMTVNRSSDARNVMQNSKNLDPLIPMNSDYAEQLHLNVDLTTIENSLRGEPHLSFDLGTNR